MRKEIQIVEWLFLVLGLLLLLFTQADFFVLFSRIFEGYYLFMTLGIGLWMAVRRWQRQSKKNRAVFLLSQQAVDDIRPLIIKAQLLLFISIICLALVGDSGYMYLLVVVAFLFFHIQVSRNEQPKIIFHAAHLYWDAVFYEDLEVKQFDMYSDGIVIQSSPEKVIPYKDLYPIKKEKATIYEENQLLDDVLLENDQQEIVQQFIFEVERYAKKMKVPIQRYPDQKLVTES